MKQFFKILGFEYGNYSKNKLFVAVTILLILVTGGVLFAPAIIEKTQASVPVSSDGDKKVMLLSDASGAVPEETLQFMREVLPNHHIMLTFRAEDEILSELETGAADMAVIVSGELDYKYIVKTAGLADSTTTAVNTALIAQYRLKKMLQLGISAEDSAQLLSATVNSETVVTGTDQSKTFIYTYILMMLLYMAIMLYGQFVAQSIVNEKSSRAMELLVTCASPKSLMFGKVLGAGFAGLTQLLLLLVSAYVFYNANSAYWSDNPMVASAFDMPGITLGYTVLFFVLGFFLFAFMYGALGSLASHSEDINTLTLPVNFLLIAALIITMVGVTGDKMESMFVKIFSFVPFTSPLVMFSRICMSEVPPAEIAISVGVLFASIVLTGLLASKIYRLGVLMYGKPPRIHDIAVLALQRTK